MRRILLIIAVVSFVTLALFGCTLSTGASLSTDQKEADFEYLYQTMKTNYPSFDMTKRRTGIDWLAQHDVCLTRVKQTRNDLQYVGVLKSILVELHQQHTNLVDPQLYNLLLPTYQAFQGEQNSQPWLDVLENPTVKARYKWWGDHSKAPKQVMTTSTPSGLETEIIELGRVGYLKVDNFLYQNIERDRPQLDEFLGSIKDFPYLVIDIRGNPGGSDQYWRDEIFRRLINEPLQFTRYSLVKDGEVAKKFLPMSTAEWLPADQLPSNMSPLAGLVDPSTYCLKQTITVQPQNSVGFSGRMILLVDGRVFSSAENFAFYVKNSGWATIVGRPTGGDGCEIDSGLFMLPESSLVIRCRLEMGLNLDGTINAEYGTKPDVEIGPDEDALEVALRMTH